MGYKEQHEKFVSSGKGTTVLHIALTTAACLLTVFLRDAVVAVLPSGTKSKLENSPWLGLMFDFLLVIIPVQLMLTILSGHIPFLLFLFTLLTWITFNIKLRTEDAKAVKRTVVVGEINMGSRRPFITYYRAFMNIVTAISILAVDFKIFPRYFAKTETYGTGLMDMGVGGFLVSNAIVSPEARGIMSTESIPAAVWKSIKSSLPLFALGMIRVVSVKSLDYQENVTEYGVHWNFFFTLAVVKLGCTLLFCGLSPRLWNVIGVLTIAIYQHSLTYDGLKDYIIKGADGRGGRVDLIDANREGLYSCIGFLSLYIMGVQLGKVVMRKREKVSDWIKLCMTLIVLGTASWVLLHFSIKHVEPISRRFANLSYLLWMMKLNILAMLVCLVFDIAVTCLTHIITLQKNKESANDKDSTVSTEAGYSTCGLVSAVNYNGLFYFLFANLLTGLVNMSMKTIYQSKSVAMVVVTAYMFVLSAVSYTLYRRKIQLKIW